MIVYIEEFGFHRDVEYKFDNGLIVLIRGKSGIGKTTILRAIKWVLYGGTLEGSSRAAVTIQYGDYVINRHAPPDCLSVMRRTSSHTKDDNLSLTGVPAQAIINKIFGNASLFELCCFLKAGSYGTAPMPLFDTNPAVRLHTLTMLTFPDDNDPQIIVDAVRDHLKSEKKLGKAQLEVYKAAKREYDLRGDLPDIQYDTIDSLTTAIVLMKDNLSERVRSESEMTQVLRRRTILTEKQVSLNKVVISVTEVLDKSLIDSSRPTDLTADIQRKKVDIIAILDKDERTLQRLVAKRTEYESVRAVQNFAKPLLEELVKSGVTLENIPKTFSQKQLQQINNTNAAMTTAKKVCADLDIPYIAEIISATISSYEQCLSYLKARKEKLAYDRAKLEYDQLTKIDVVVLEAELAYTKAGRTLRQCPHCLKGVRIENDCLVKATVSLTTIQDVQVKEGELRDARRTNEMKETRRRVMDTLATKAALTFKQSADFEEYGSNEANVSIIDNTLMRLRSIVFTTQSIYSDRQAELLRGLTTLGWTIELETSTTIESSDVTSQHIHQTIQENRIKLAHINEELNESYKTQSQYEMVLQQRLLLEERLRVAKSNLVFVDEELISLNVLHSNLIDSIDRTVGSTYEAIDCLTDRLSALHKRLNMLEQAERVELLRINADRISQNIINVSLLLQEAVSEHFARLKSVVDAVNIHLASVTLELFSYAMSIQLSLYAITTKTNKIPKHTVSIEIIRRGDLVPRFESSLLSEGEKQRIVLVVLLALGMYVGLVNIPLLLLDEPMQRLNSGERDSALGLLRKINHKRTIIITEHNTIDDEYDHVIALDNS